MNLIISEKCLVPPFLLHHPVTLTKICYSEWSNPGEEFIRISETLLNDREKTFPTIYIFYNDDDFLRFCLI